MKCPHCSGELPSEPVFTGVQLPTPVYPMYDMRVAAELIPCSYEAIKAYISRNKAEYPARFRVYEDEHRRRRRVRVLSSREILQIRANKLRGPGKATQ